MSRAKTSGRAAGGLSAAQGQGDGARSLSNTGCDDRVASPQSDDTLGRGGFAAGNHFHNDHHLVSELQ